MCASRYPAQIKAFLDEACSAAIGETEGARPAAEPLFFALTPVRLRACAWGRKRETLILKESAGLRCARETPLGAWQVLWSMQLHDPPLELVMPQVRARSRDRETE